jgi:hypothetical protein
MPAILCRKRRILSDKKMLTYHDLYAILMEQRKKSFFFALNSGNGFEAAQARN